MEFQLTDRAAYDWNQVWEYVYSFKERIHVFGSKELGWIRVSWPNNSEMICRSVHYMQNANQVVQKALRFVRK